MASRPTPTTYRQERDYPRLAAAVDVILRRGKVVAPVEVLVEMSFLSKANLEEWRFGRVPFLERVMTCNLSRLRRLLRVLRLHAHDLNLTPSVTAYTRSGRGAKQRLRFTKTGEARLEEAYATHLIWPGKRPFHDRESAPPGAGEPLSSPQEE